MAAARDTVTASAITTAPLATVAATRGDTALVTMPMGMGGNAATQTLTVIIMLTLLDDYVLLDMEEHVGACVQYGPQGGATWV